MRRLFVTAGLLVLVAGCFGGTDYKEPPPPPGDGGQNPDAGTDGGVVPRTDGGNVLVGEWNLEFFGKTDAGPGDEALQAQNVATVMGQQNADLWALEEVCDEAELNGVLDTLRGSGEDYVAVFPDTSSVSNPYKAYGGTWGQKTTLLFRSGMFEKLSAELVYSPKDTGTGAAIDPSWGTTFGGRDPLEVHLQASTDAGTEDLWVIVVHLKAQTDPPPHDFNQRSQESADLKAYLDQYHPNDRVMVVGDWNDDLDTSVDGVDPTPFQNFLDDGASYAFASLPFTQSNTPTTVKYPTAIDHHLITNELFGSVIQGSQRVLTSPPIQNYSRSTSDHYPTFVEYHLP